MLAMSDIIKVSDEDLAWLHPGAEPQTVVRNWLANGASIVLLTQGSRGAAAFTRRFALEIGSLNVPVVDTVGAGDAFNAGILRSLSKSGVLNKSALAEVSEDVLGEALKMATSVAAFTIGQTGARSPWADELTSDGAHPKISRLSFDFHP